MSKYRIVAVSVAILAFIVAVPIVLSFTQVAPTVVLGSSPLLSCSPAPCVLPPLLISGGPSPLWTNLTVVSNPTDPAKLVVAATDASCDSAGIFSSQDGGANWHHSCLPAAKVFPGQRPLLAYGSDGVVYAGMDGLLGPRNYSQIEINSSLDNGNSWSAPAVAAARPYLYANRLEVDNSPTSPFQNSLYVAGGVFDLNEIVVFRSSDAGKTWSRSIVDKRGGLLLDYFPSIAVGADGMVYASWLLCDQKFSISCADTIGRMMFSKSGDGGLTWSTPSEIARTTLAPGSDWTWGTLPGTALSMSNAPVLAVDNSGGPHSGNIYASFYDYEGNYMHVAVVTSSDRGQTWGPPVRVSHSPVGDQFFQWVSVSEDGKVGVTWLDTRKADRVQYQPYFAVSTDGGATFTGDRPLTPYLSDPLKDPRTSYFGEFRTHTWAGNTLYAVWPDNHVSELRVAIGGVQF